jgi:membrane associated rhomboid family serine protease
MRGSGFESQRSLTVTLLIVNAVAFVLQSIFYGYPPRFPAGDVFALSVEGLQRGFVWQLLTYQFMHGGLIHLLVNCWVIFVFGRELEHTLGRKNFLILYFASGIAGGLLQIAGAVMAPDYFGGAVVGASAGAFGLVAAFAVLYPERPLTLLLFFIIPVSMRAKFLLLFSALLAIFGILFSGGHIAHAAHLGGMIAGIFYVRNVIHWNWPRIRIRSASPPRKLMRVAPQKNSLWGRSDDTVADNLPPEEFVSREVDPILDKISAQGIQSLTEQERKILEAARAKMAKR